VTDCVAVPELRWPTYDSITVNYGALKRCCGPKRCYGRTKGGPSEAGWGPWVHGNRCVLELFLSWHIGGWHEQFLCFVAYLVVS
jgi:hypothetical protein